MKRTRLMNRMFSDATSPEEKQQVVDLISKAKETGNADNDKLSAGKVGEKVYVEDKENGEVTAVTDTPDKYEMEAVKAKEDASKPFAEAGTPSDNPSAAPAGEGKDDLEDPEDHEMSELFSAVGELVNSVNSFKTAMFAELDELKHPAAPAVEPTPGTTMKEDKTPAFEDLKKGIEDLKGAVTEVTSGTTPDEAKLKVLTQSATALMSKVDKLFAELEADQSPNINTAENPDKSAPTGEYKEPEVDDKGVSTMKESLEAIKAMCDSISKMSTKKASDTQTDPDMITGETKTDEGLKVTPEATGEEKQFSDTTGGNKVSDNVANVERLFRLQAAN